MKLLVGSQGICPGNQLRDDLGRVTQTGVGMRHVLGEELERDGERQ